MSLSGHICTIGQRWRRLSARGAGSLSLTIDGGLALFTNFVIGKAAAREYTGAQRAERAR